MAQKRIQIEILVEGLPANHSVVADLANWNVRVQGIKNPIPFEFHGTWLFKDDAMINEIVEAGGFCGGLCWAFHSCYPSYMVSNISPGHRSIKCDVIIKHSAEDEFLQAIDDGTMSKVLQSSMKEIPNKFNNLEQLYEPIKIIRIKRIYNDSQTTAQQEYTIQNLGKELEYWKSKSTKLVKSRIEVELERDNGRDRCEELQKNLHDAKEKNVELIKINEQVVHKLSEEISKIKIELHKEKQKREPFERENKKLQSQISEMEVAKLQIEKSKGELIKDHNNVLQEKLNLEATVQSLKEEIQLEVQKSFTLTENLNIIKEEAETLKNHLQDKEEEFLDYNKVLQEKIKLEATAQSLEEKINLEVKECLTLKEDIKISKEEVETLKNNLQDKEQKILDYDEVLQQKLNLEVTVQSLEEKIKLEGQNCLTLKEDLNMSKEEAKILKNLLGHKEKEFMSELRKEEQKSQRFEKKNKELENKISEIEATKLPNENSKKEAYDELLQEKNNLDATVKSLEEEIKLEMQKCLSLKEDLKIGEEEAENMKNQLGDKEKEISKWRSRSENLETQNRDLEESCNFLKESIKNQCNGRDSPSSESLTSELSSGEDDIGGDLEMNSASKKINDNEKELAELKLKIEKYEKRLRDSELEAVRLRGGQRRTEVRMEAREQAHRDQVVALKREIDYLHLQLVTKER